MPNIKRQLCFIFLFIITHAAFAETAVVEDTETQATPITISQEAIASLAAHLSEEKFAFIGSELVGKPFSGLNFAALTEHETLSFTPEEIEHIRNSLGLYFEALEKIKAVAPLIRSSAEVSGKVQKLNASIDSLLAEEKETVLAEIDELKVQLETHRADFKNVAEASNLKAINFEKLPGMLTDLNYEGDAYELMQQHITEYLGLMSKVSTSDAIIQSLAEVINQINETERDLRTAQTEEEKAEIALNLKELSERKQALENDFTINATGIDVATLNEKATEKINVEEELTRIFSPVILSLKSFTEPSRKIEVLRSDIAYYEQNIPRIRHGLEQLEVLLDEATAKKVQERLNSEQAFWTQWEKEFVTKLEIAKQQLIELENKRVRPAEAFTQFYEAIFSKRGMNIILAILTFIVVFLMINLFRQFLLWLNPFGRIPSLRFVGGIVNVFLYVFAFIAAILATIVSLYTAGETLALAIVIILLFGLVLGVREALPFFFEQFRLLLGYGPVRQGERMVYEGVPWLVESVGVFSHFSNPWLTGGVLRLPIKELIGMHSRPYDESEPWFATRTGDWVIMADGFYGEIVMQTPDMVQLNTLRGSYKAYTPKDFLAKNPQNLSINLFSVNNILNLDFEHRDIVLSEVSEKVTEILKARIEEQFYGKYLNRLIVELKTFDNSSLNVITIARFEGPAASEYTEIGWLLQQAALEACNKYGWEISTNQVTLHQPEPYQLVHLNSNEYNNNNPALEDKST